MSINTQRRVIRPNPAAAGIAMVVFGIAAAGFLFWQEARKAASLNILRVEGTVERYSHESKRWSPLEPGQWIESKDRIRTGKNGLAEIKMSNHLNVRLAEDSLAEIKSSRTMQGLLDQELVMLKGILMGATNREFQQKARLKVKTPNAVAAIRGTVFRIETAGGSDSSTWLGVLKGAVGMRLSGEKDGRSVKVESHEKAEAMKGQLTEPETVNQDEWKRIAQALDLIPTHLDFQQQQLDLSKEAGNLFRHAFDHGAFYDPSRGFAAREFFRDPETKSVHLQMDYDAYLPGSFVGMYMKTRDLDLALFRGLEFEIRRPPGQEGPERCFVEFKNADIVMKKFTIRPISQSWRKVSLPIRLASRLQVTEVVIYFTHEGVGPKKYGTIELRNLNLISTSQIFRADQ